LQVISKLLKGERVIKWTQFVTDRWTDRWMDISSEFQHSYNMMNFPSIGTSPTFIYIF